MLSNSSPSTFMNRYQLHVSGAGFSLYTGGAGFSYYTWVWVMLRLWSTVIWGLSIRAWPLTKTYLRKYGYRISNPESPIREEFLHRVISVPLTTPAYNLTGQVYRRNLWRSETGNRVTLCSLTAPYVDDSVPILPWC